jgi:putative spermidine/putrescine transport system substrate-binding protein
VLPGSHQCDTWGTQPHHSRLRRFALAQTPHTVEQEDEVKRTRVLALTMGAALTVSALAACAPPAKDSGGSSSKAASATSAEDLGGMDALVKQAKEEGTLNVIALPPDWANYGNIIKAFQDKYGIKVQSDQPDAASQDEINAAQQLKGTERAPDVFDLGQSVALANTDMYAPYKVSTWNDVPDEFKDSDGTWVNDYGGYMSIGYDSKKVPEVTSLDDLLKPQFKGKVALNGDPTQAGAAFSGVMMASVLSGGSAGDLKPGVDFFAKLKKAGNLIPVDPTSATIESGQTPVVIDWDYLNAAESAKLPSWKVVVPGDKAVAGYYYQAINKDAPHPAAARLWEEFLYSDEGQNLWLAGGARPVRADAMDKAGTIDKAKYDALPKVTGETVLPTNEQNAAGAKYLADNWAKAVG